MSDARQAVQTWFFSLGPKYGVNPIVFGSIYVGAIPFFSLSIARLIRNLRSKKSAVLPLLSAGFFFVSAYLYLLVASKNIPVWVYFIIAGLVVLGIASTIIKVKKGASQP